MLPLEMLCISPFDPLNLLDEVIVLAKNVTSTNGKFVIWERSL